MTEEIRYRLLRFLEEKPYASQREIARCLGVSVGQVNYCVRALVEKGLLKIRNFRNSKNKLMYAYHLTPKGIEDKVDVTYSFLRRKMAEYESLSAQIEELKREIRDRSASVSSSRL